jgi:MGT family glycosyltransferase
VFVNEEALNLVLGVERFQPKSSRISTNHTFIGPTNRVGRAPKTYDLIYASLGSVFVTNRAFFDVCIEALGEIGRRAVISLSDGFSPSDFDRVPPNVALARFVAQNEILQQTALFITHGGAGGVYEAILSATPMLVVPQIPEQRYYGREIERAGLGRCIEPHELTAPLLRSMVRDMIGDDGFRDRLRAFKAGLPAVPASTAACDHIEALARTGVARA